MTMKTLLGTGLITLSILSGCTNGETALLEQANETIQLLELANLQLSEEIDAVKEHIEKLSDEKERLLSDNQALEEENIRLTSEIVELKENLEDIEMKSSDPTVVALSEHVMMLLADEDFISLSDYVHPVNGLRFTPYPYIDMVNDVVMTPVDVSNFGSSTTVYTWGSYDGSGDVISGTPMDYYAEFIYDENYLLPDMMAWNSPIGTGNMINNMTAAYPTADYVEFHFTGFNPAYSGMDWSSLTLVFEQMGSNWYLVGLVHGQWTT